jgi:hypothetical protein
MPVSPRRIVGVTLVIVIAGIATGLALPALPLDGLTGAGAVPSASPSAPGVTQRPSPTSTPTPPPTPTPTPTPTPEPTPSPTPALVPAPLSGRLVSREVADQLVLAVMVDDHPRARPQSGLNSAAVVWHAPAEGGVPRYLMLFQDRLPYPVGPVRSARLYFIAWASEWRSAFARVGGSPQARRILAESGDGELVYDIDEYVWGPAYLWRIGERSAPHNVYTDGEHLREVAARLGAVDAGVTGVWRFEPDPPLARRPAGATIRVPYQYNTVDYAYDRASNRWIRSVTGASPQIDAADGEPVAPSNVVVMYVPFRPLDDGHPEKGRLEADVIGSGPALIGTDGLTIEGTWQKDAFDAPTRFRDTAGRDVTLTTGQTFVQVVPTGTKVRVVPGRPVTATPAP